MENMSNRITDWNRAVRIEMIMRGLTYDDIMKATGFTRQYISQIINGKVYSAQAIKAISDYLMIPDGDFRIQIKYIPKTR